MRVFLDIRASDVQVQCVGNFDTGILGNVVYYGRVGDICNSSFAFEVFLWWSVVGRLKEWVLMDVEWVFGVKVEKGFS